MSNQMIQTSANDYALFMAVAGERRILIAAEDAYDALAALSDLKIKGDTELFDFDGDRDQTSELLIAVNMPELYQSGTAVCGILVDRKMSGEALLTAVRDQFADLVEEEGRTSGFESIPSEMVDSIQENPKLGDAIIDAYNLAAKDKDQPAWLPMSTRAAAYLGDTMEDHKIVQDGAFFGEETPWFESGYSSRVEAAATTVAEVCGAEGLAGDFGPVFVEGISDAARDSFEEACFANDTSSVVDLIDFDTMLTWRPLSMTGDIIYCDANTGSAGAVIPDQAFADWLSDMNISSKEWIEFMSNQGVDLLEVDDVGGSSWNEFSVEKRLPGQAPIVSPEDVMEIVDNCNGYGEPILAIEVNMKQLLDVLPGQTLRVSGGQYGLHDFFNGSGHIEDVIHGHMDITMNPDEWHSDSSARYGVDAVYGMTRQATQGDLDLSLDQSHQILGQAYADEIKAVLADPAKYSVREDGVRILKDGSWPNYGKTDVSLVDQLTAVKQQYGHWPDAFDTVLNDAELSVLRPAVAEPSM